MSKINNSKEFRNQIENLFDTLEIKESILKLSEKAYNSGMLDTSNLDSTSFGEAKAVLSAIFSSLSVEIRPLSPEYKEIFNDMRKIV